MGTYKRRQTFLAVKKAILQSIRLSGAALVTVEMIQDCGKNRFNSFCEKHNLKIENDEARHAVILSFQ